MSEAFVPDSQNKEFQDALSLIRFTRQSVFLTGRAGTGKSTFLRYVSAHTHKKHVILAPTGIAAVNCGGMTLHSFFKLPFHPLLPDDRNLSGSLIYDYFKYRKSHRKLLEDLELIIIDEISMVRADIIDVVDRILRVFSHNTRLPFGGKQLLLVGDMFQLEPVVTSDDRDILSHAYPNAFFFSAKVWEQIQLVSVELQKVYRQRDPVFVGILDRIRSNTVNPADLRQLNLRYDPATTGGSNMPGGPDDLRITLATRRDTVDHINERRLAALPGEPVTFQGIIKGEFPVGSLPTSLELTLKEGAQIIFIRNDVNRRWVNGTLGRISGHINPDGDVLRVITDNGMEYPVGREVWENVRYTYDEETKTILEEVLGTFTQFPLRLAWAITIHKSQGLTFSRATIDLSGRAFAGGQTYVALSRCTSLEGITLTRPVTQADIFVNPVITRFASQYNDRQALDRALKLAEADRQYLAAVEAFDKGDFETFLNEFFRAIRSRYDIEKPLIRRYIRRKLGIINTLRRENDRLHKLLDEQQQRMAAYAHEYYLMGNACITDAHDARAALANYDKALRLDPGHTDALVRKGLTLFGMGRTDEALDCLHEAVRRRPADFKAVYNRGRVRLLLGQAEEALSDLDRATSLRPDHATAHRLLGNALQALGREDEAELQWRIAKELRSKLRTKN